MGPVLTVRARAGYSGSATTVFPTASFTPSASAKLYAFAWSQADTGSPTLSIAGGGLTWTQKATAGPTDGGGRVYLWEADTSGSPSSMTITITASANAYVAHEIFDVTGTSPAIVSGQIASSTQPNGTTTVTTGTLPGAATTGNLSILCCGYNNDVTTQPAGDVSTPAGWTSQITEQQGFESARLFTLTTFTGTSVSFANSTANNEAVGTILFEIAEGGSPAAARVPLAGTRRAAIVRASTY